MDKTLTLMWGVALDFWREHRRLRLQLDHDKAMTTALQELNEAANQLKTAPGAAVDEDRHRCAPSLPPRFPGSDKKHPAPRPASGHRQSTTARRCAYAPPRC